MRNGTAAATSARLDLERALAHYAYRPGPRAPLVEQMRFPEMVPIFRRLVEVNGGLPPSQRDFEQVVVYELGARIDPAICGRARRTWPSLVVQLHAKVTLEESYPLVTWDSRADMEYGLDLIVYGQDWEPVAVRLRVATEAGNSAASVKEGRYRPSRLVVRELVCDPSEHPVGPFWLFSSARLVNEVEEALYEARGRRASEHDDELWQAGFQMGLESQ